MPNTTPPFRADHVGSLLRPATLKEARARHTADLAAIEDREIARIIARQEEIGLSAVTDGELRRAAWQWDFLGGLEGVRTDMGGAAGVNFKGIVTPSRATRVVGKVGWGRHPMIDHFRFVKRATRATAKMCIPSPTHLASTTRDWRSVVDRAIYPELPPLFHDLALAYQKALRAFADAGCTYLQLDDCNFAFLCDPAVQQKMRAQGDDPDWLLHAYAELVARSLDGRPAGMTITMHSCRGNFRSTYLTEGSWEAVADVLFNTVPVDGFFLEYDTDRAGGFEPLRFMPKDKAVVLGLVSSKSAWVEPEAAIRRRIDEAARYVPLDRLCLSPQCGFASTEEGNALTEDEQWRKLAAVVEIAAEVWR